MTKAGSRPAAAADESAAASTGRSRGTNRRNALIATAIALPVTLILAFALAPSGTKTASNGPLAAVTVTAPAANPANDAACTQVLTALPTELAGLAPRQVKSDPASPYVLAWGNPAVVLRCGVGKPADLVPGSSDVAFLSGVYWLQSADGGDDVFTSVDRSVYVEVRVPKSLTVQPLPLLGAAIASKLPAVCSVPDGNQTVPDSELCTHRP
ncbi:uncharacterized protein DUF3515 [Jatrophihabitans sp. GAS493]|uniref:DUF3515 domain-containing protein n=1 Tax=Jatrophihabitans sp. GAS493 TaxID=1907575 RepID=UPI000BBF43EA|nr:DUF3515 domain-containing protein [Jatrophihabitans sp. GAS493]SOD73423.1 uncharacterized protein DUF3515 [Jatrophihabitans sp. GAS493]